MVLGYLVLFLFELLIVVIFLNVLFFLVDVFEYEDEDYVKGVSVWFLG